MIGKTKVSFVPLTTIGIKGIELREEMAFPMQEQRKLSVFIGECPYSGVRVT